LKCPRGLRRSSSGNRGLRVSISQPRVRDFQEGADKSSWALPPRKLSHGTTKTPTMGIKGRGNQESHMVKWDALDKKYHGISRGNTSRICHSMNRCLNDRRPVPPAGSVKSTGGWTAYSKLISEPKINQFLTKLVYLEFGHSGSVCWLRARLSVWCGQWPWTRKNVTLTDHRPYETAVSKSRARAIECMPRKVSGRQSSERANQRS